MHLTVIGNGSVCVRSSVHGGYMSSCASVDHRPPQGTSLECQIPHVCVDGGVRNGYATSKVLSLFGLRVNTDIDVT